MTITLKMIPKNSGLIITLKSWKKLLSKARLINRLPETIKFKKYMIKKKIIK